MDPLVYGCRFVMSWLVELDWQVIYGENGFIESSISKTICTQMYRNSYVIKHLHIRLLALYSLVQDTKQTKRTLTSSSTRVEGKKVPGRLLRIAIYIS